MHENAIGTIVVESAIAIHSELGPGLLESVYQAVMAHELRSRGLQIRTEVPVPIRYRGIEFGEGFPPGIIIEGKVILELKSIEKVTAAHKKQIQTYLH